MKPAVHSKSRTLGVAATLLAAVIAAASAPEGLAQAMPAPAMPGGVVSLDQLSTWERRDMGIAAPRGLHDGALHGPTPNQIPGGQVITTKGLLPLLQQRDLPVQVFHVLGGGQMLPRAIAAAWASQPGSFDDGTQQQMAQMLRQVTRGNAAAPLVFYCASPECWMSYNAAARAIRLGYKNVLWYRGGLAAWQQAGLPLAESAGAGMPPGQPQGAAGSRPPGALPPDAFGPAGGVRQ